MDHLIGKDIRKDEEEVQDEDIETHDTLNNLRRSLRKHQRAIHEGIKYLWDQCIYKTGRQQSLRKHKENKHSGNLNDFDFYSSDALLDKGNDKIILPIKQEGETFYCDQCNYQTGRNGDLRKHRQSKHEGVTYACGKCEYQPKDRSSLRKHQKAVHEGVRYPCDQCDYKTGRPQSFNNHKQIKHTQPQ